MDREGAKAVDWRGGTGGRFDGVVGECHGVEVAGWLW